VFELWGKVGCFAEIPRAFSYPAVPKGELLKGSSCPYEIYGIHVECVAAERFECGREQWSVEQSATIFQMLL
jgi:hypothetical protein